MRHRMVMENGRATSTALRTINECECHYGPMPRCGRSKRRGEGVNYRSAAELLCSGKDVIVANEEDARGVSGEVYRIEKEKRKSFYPIGKIVVNAKTGG